MRTFGFQWHLTDRCNLRCLHCYQEDFTPASERDLEALKAMADRIFRALPDRQVSINLTGGEPLLLSGLFELIDHLHTYPNLYEIHLITNATLATEKLLAGIRRAEKLRTLKVSLESGVAAVNDAVRGAGNFARVTENLRRFREQTGKAQVLMMTLAGHNLASIPATVAYGRERGLEGIIFERFVPLGQSRAIAGQVLTPRQWREAVLEILRAAQLPVDPDTLLPYKAFWLWFNRAESLTGALCNLGDESMALMPDGAVYPCRRLPIPLGNVLDEPFPEILRRLEPYAVPVLRERLTGELCGMCGVEECAGCRALARALTGNLFADDPQCPLRASEDA